MRNRKLKLISSVVTASMLAGTLGSLSVMAEEEQGHWVTEDDGNHY